MISLDLIKNRHDIVQQQTRNRFVDFKRWENWYDGILPDELRTLYTGEYKDKASLVSPLTRTCINDLRARIVGSIFSVHPHFELTSEITGIFNILQKNKKLVMMQFDQEEEAYRSKISDQVLDWLLWGIGLKGGRWRTSKDILTGELYYEGFGFDMIDPYKFYPSTPDSDGNLKYYFIISVFDYGELLERANRGELDLDKVKKINLSRWSEIESQVDNYVIGTDVKSLNLNKPEDQQICPVMIWSYRDRDEYVIVANEKDEISRINNPEELVKSPNLGLSVLNLGRKKGSFYGKSAIDIIEDLIFEKFFFRNERADELKLSIGSQFFTDDPNAPAQFKAGVGRIHKVNQGMTERYKPVEFRGNPAGTLNEESMVTNELKQVLGLNDLFMGGSPERRETATTNLIMQQNASTELSFSIGQIEDKVIAPDVIMCLIYDAQLLPAQLPSAYAGLEMTKEEIIYRLKVKPLGMTQQTARSVIASQITGLMEQWKTIPPLMQGADFIELGKRQLVALQLPDPDKILPDPMEKLIPIQKENYFLFRGIFVPVNPSEDHDLHLKLHQGVPNSEQHISDHTLLLQEKLAQASPNKMRGTMITDEDSLIQSTQASTESKSPQLEGVL